jgi:formate dehydrogenase major subunit
MGLDWSYGHPSEVFAEMKHVMKSLDNITWERLEREEVVTYPCDGPNQPGNEVMFANGFPTASGRARIVPAELVDPDEMPDNNYPMILTTGRMLEHWHTGSMTRRASVLDALEPEAVVSVSPRDIARLGLTPGDWVRVGTRRGAISLKVRQDGAVPEGALFIPFCFAEAPANFLTNPRLDPFGKIPEFKFCAAKVEPIAEPAAAE